jgi:hypothetical protein
VKGRASCLENYVANSILVSVSQASLFGSEIWFLCLAADLFLSLSNPFSNYKTNRRRYYVAVTVVTVMSCAAWLLILNEESMQDWFCTLLNSVPNAGASPLWVALLFGASYFVWCICIPILVFAYRKLKQGLSETLEKRQVHISGANACVAHVLTRRMNAHIHTRARCTPPYLLFTAFVLPMLNAHSKICRRLTGAVDPHKSLTGACAMLWQEAIVTMQRWIFVHALYTLICAIALVYTVSVKRGQGAVREGEAVAQAPYCTLLAPVLVLRGLVTFIVWVSLHRSAVWARVRADGFGADALSPALNHELRKEVVGCTTRGIRIAVAHRRKFQLQWSRDGSYSYAFVDIFLAPRDETRQRCYDSFEQDGGSRHSLLPHTTGPSSTQTVKFRDHEPDLFRELRELLGISNDEYALSAQAGICSSFARLHAH